MKWIKIVRYVGWTILGIGAAVASGMALMLLAKHAGGWPRGTEILLPVSIDVFAVLAIIEWRTAATPEIRRDAKRKAWGAIIVSGIGNAISHLVVAGVIPVHWVLTAAVGSIPAVALGLAVHMALEPLSAREPKAGSQDTDQAEIASEAPAQPVARALPTEPIATLEVRPDAPTPDVLDVVVKNLQTYRAEHQKLPSRTYYRQRFGQVSNETFATARKVASNGHKPSD